LDAADIVTQGAAAAGFAKILVDLVKLSPLPTVSKALPVLAFIFSESCAFLLAATNPDTVFDRPTISVIVLVGIGATAGAIAITTTQTKADRVEERLDTALRLQPGSDKADVDSAIARSDAKVNQ
jgi:hypothetical protein